MKNLTKKEVKNYCEFMSKELKNYAEECPFLDTFVKGRGYEESFLSRIYFQTFMSFWIQTPEDKRDAYMKLYLKKMDYFLDYLCKAFDSSLDRVSTPLV